MMTTVRLTYEPHGYATESTRDLAEQAVEALRGGDLILGSGLSAGDIDYAAADLLEILVALHDDGDIERGEPRVNLELLPQVRAFAIGVLTGRWAD